MKQLIFGFGILILWTAFSIFQIDNNKYIRFQEDLKYQADECSSAAALHYNLTQYGNGKKIYDTVKGNNAIENILKLNMNLDNSLMPRSNTYLTETIEYYVYYFDDSGFRKVYKNGVLQEKALFSFNYLFVEPLTGYQKLISQPTVIVTVNAGKPKFRLTFIKPDDIIRTSAYEYLGKK